MSTIDRLLDLLSLSPDEGFDDDYEDDDYGFDDLDLQDERELKRQAAREKKAALKEQKAREKEELAEARARQRQQEQEEKERRRAQRAEEEAITSRRNDSARDSYPTEKRESVFKASSRSYSDDMSSRSSERESKTQRQQSKITPMTAKTAPRKQSYSMDEVCVIKPTNFNEETEITDTILSGKPVIINMEGLDVQVAQRIVDFTLGATYAINGNFQRITNYIFLATPKGVDISGDITAEGDLSL